MSFVFVLLDDDVIPSHRETDYGCSEGILKFYKEHVNRGSMLNIFSQQPRSLGMLFNTDGLSSTLAKDKGSVGYLPTGHPFRFHIYNILPCSMVRKSFYDEHVAGKAIPWLNSTYLTFDINSIIPYRPESPLTVDGLCGPMDVTRVTKVHGLGLLPFILGGIPILAQVLIVDDIFPNQRPRVNATRFDAIFDDDIFNKFRDTLRSVSYGIDKTMSMDADQTKDTTAKLKITTGNNGKRILSVWVDGSCINNGSNHVASIKGGIGIFYAVKSAFNTSLPTESAAHEKPITSQRAELLAGLQALRQILTLRHYHGYIFDLAEVYSDSEYLVRGVTEWLEIWKNRQWKNARGTLVENKDLWVELDELISKNFCTHKDSNEYHTKLNLTWFRVPRTENLEADELAKAGADKDRPVSSRKKLDYYDQGESVRRLDLGYEDGPNSSQAVKVKVVHAGIKSLGLPEGYSLAVSAARATERTL